MRDTAMRTGATLVVSLALTVLLATPALADRGITVGPTRQLVKAGDNGEVRISNPSDQTVLVTPVLFGYQDGWVELPDAPISLSGVYRIRPGDSYNVPFYASETATTDCAYYGIRWTFQPRGNQPVNGILVQGAVMTEVLIQGLAGAESDCVALLPAAGNTAASTSPRWLWLTPLAVLLLVPVIWRRYRYAKPNAYGFGR